MLKWDVSNNVNFVQHSAQGFSYSVAESVFIVQKKNHIQLSCRVSGAGQVQYNTNNTVQCSTVQGAKQAAIVATNTGKKKIEHFQLNFYGVKTEAPEQRIQVCFRQLFLGFGLKRTRHI